MVRITILLVMYINCLSKYSVYLRWPSGSLICDVDHSLRLVRTLLNGQYNVSNSLQTIIYISSRYLISPEATLGGISAKNAAPCFSSRRETMNPGSVCMAHTYWSIYRWLGRGSGTTKRSGGSYICKGGNYINLYGTVCITKQKGLAPNLCRTTVVVLDSGS